MLITGLPIGGSCPSPLLRINLQGGCDPPPSRATPMTVALRSTCPTLADPPVATRPRATTVKALWSWRRAAAKL